MDIVDAAVRQIELSNWIDNLARRNVQK